MFDKKYAYHYLVAIGVLGLASYFGDKIKQGLNSDDEENELIRKYLLNESPLYGLNRPKLWIHSTYEINARKWKDFMSRNTTDLNQPYIHQTIRTIINHCGSDFNICLIDDESFSKLIPNWPHNLASMAEPHRSQYRDIGMIQVLYLYGGIIVPNSFVCLKNLAPLYAETSEGRPFIGECISRSNSGSAVAQKFAPSIKFMGARKGCSTIKKMLDENKAGVTGGHFTSEPRFVGSKGSSDFSLVDGKLIGTKTRKGKPILLEDLMGENYLDLDPDAYGIMVPGDEILMRTKYEWFAVLPTEQLMKTNPIIVKYIMSSQINESFVQKSVSSI
jgi:hypothetical protein